jgi:carboxyl-terminal processing protease
MKNIRLLPVIALILVLTLLFSPAALAASTAAPQGDLAASQYYLRLYAFFQPGDDVLKATSLEDMVAAMQTYDPYFNFLSAEEIEEMSGTYAGSYVGIGILMEINAAGEIVIKAVYGDTVAARAGFLAGDILYSVDGVRLQGKSLSEAQTLLIGDGVPDSIVSVTIQRNNWTQTYDVARKLMGQPSVTYWMLAEGAAYLHIERFTLDTSQQIETAITYLQGLGMRSLVLDLRDCGGGIMHTAAETTELLLNGGPIYYSLSNRGIDSLYYMEPALEKTNVPLAVLINEHTASAAELVAAVMQDEGRGLLIGSPTYGKGYFQSLLMLPSGNGVYMTTGKYISRGLQDIAAQHGATPDMLVRSLDDAAGVDEQLAAALKWLAGQQALPYELVLSVGSSSLYADGVARSGIPAPFLKNGSCYLPASAVLSRLGWNLEWRGGLCYGVNSPWRLILDPAHNQVLSGNQTADTLTVKGHIYLPAAFFRNIGYTVSWNSGNRSVSISR